MSILENLSTMIVEALGPNGPLMLVGSLGFIMVLMTLPILLKRPDDPLDKLKVENTDNITGKRLRTGTANDKLEKYANFLEPQDAHEYSAMKLKLLQAGYQGKSAVRTFYFCQFALGLLGLVAGSLYIMFLPTDYEVTSKDLGVWIGGLGGGGYLLPKYWVTRRQAMRQEAIENGFPDCLDMLLVCVEAGQSLDQAIIRVSNELQSGFPELCYEFELVAQEMKAGKEKDAVLKDMAERAGVQDITSFVTVLVQSQQFGTSIADALRVYSSEMRDKRVMKAEEKANKLPTKMTLATMMLTVPPLLIMLIGPSVHEMSLAFKMNPQEAAPDDDS
jgi:tight adherence protein C